MNPSRPPEPAEDARARLIGAGLRLFAQQGYAKTSTRALAEAAQVNVASISYYFGDKQGLYRAVFTEPLCGLDEQQARIAIAGRPLTQVLRAFFAGFIEPLRQGDVARLCMKLHYREMLEPTGLTDVTRDLGIHAMHDTLVQSVRRHLGLARADDELHRLAIAIAGLGMQLHTGREVTDQIAPQLHRKPAALDRWGDSLVRYALALVRAEAEHRGLPMADPERVPNHETHAP